MLFYGTKNEVHLKGTIETIYTCEDVYEKKYRGVYLQKFCDNFHGTGDFDPFSEKFFLLSENICDNHNNFYGNIYPCMQFVA